MSSGPFHYKEAERLLDAIERAENEATASTWDEYAAESQRIAAIALVHAKLADVAARIDLEFRDVLNNSTRIAEWQEVTQ